MGIADGLARDRAQAKTLILIKRAGLEAAIIKDERLCLAIFKEEFAIVAALEAFRHKALDVVAAGVETVDQTLHKINPATYVCCRM